MVCVNDFESKSVFWVNNRFIFNLLHRNTLETSERKIMKPNAIYCGDCAQILAYFPEYSVDLIYVDPPFFSNKQDRWKGRL